MMGGYLSAVTTFNRVGSFRIVYPSSYILPRLEQHTTAVWEYNLHLQTLNLKRLRRQRTPLSGPGAHTWPS